MIYSRRNDIAFNSEINFVTVDIEKKIINGQNIVDINLIWKEFFQCYLQRTCTYF